VVLLLFGLFPSRLSAAKIVCAVEERVAIADRFAAPCVGLYPSVVELVAVLAVDVHTLLASFFQAHVNQTLHPFLYMLRLLLPAEMSAIESRAVAPAGLHCSLSQMHAANCSFG